MFQRQVGSIHRSNQLPSLPDNCGASCPSEGLAMTTSRLLAAAASALVVIGLVACAPPAAKDTGNRPESGLDAGEATPPANCGSLHRPGKTPQRSAAHQRNTPTADRDPDP